MATYLTSSLGEIRKNVFWVDKIDVVSIAPRAYVIHNTGDGEIFVAGIQYNYSSSSYNLSQFIQIGEVLTPGKILKYEPSKINEYKFEHARIIQAHPGLKIRNGGDAIGIAKDHPDCVQSDLYSINSMAYVNYSNFLGNKLIQIPIQAKIIYYSREPLPLKDSFEGVLLFSINTKRECLELNVRSLDSDHKVD